MENSQTITSSVLALSRPAGIFGVSKKVAIIRLRWPVVIICSYLLLYSRGGWGDPVMVHGFLLFYILSNAALYLVDEKLFGSSSFYTPLVIFDTLFLTASLTFSGEISTEFYLAYFLTIILCGICKDFRGLIIIALLAPLVYGYFLFRSADIYDTSLYLRLPFPFVISLFYGYFAQLEHVEKSLRERAEQEAQNMAMIHSLSQSLTSSLDYKQILRTLRDKISQSIPAANIYVFIIDETDRPSRGLLFHIRNGEEFEPRAIAVRDCPIVEECLSTGRPVFQRDVPVGSFVSGGQENARDISFPGAMAVPIAFRGETHGVILLGFGQADPSLTSREDEYGKIVAFAAAIALSNAKKYEVLRGSEERLARILEQSKKQAEELEKANKVRAEFLSVMSHELRTPLNVVMGYTGMIQDRMLGDISPEQEEALGKVLARSGDLLSMITSILQTTMLEAQGVTVESHEVHLGEFFEYLKSFYAGPQDKGLTLTWDYPPDLPVIKTDNEKLRYILQNLINNAVKFTKQGNVTVSARYFSETKTVEFKVTDTGIGIPQEALSIIFEQFRQVDSSETRPYGGVGLGLYIVNRFTEMLGGKIEVESEPGKGSTFTVILPA